MTGVAEWFGEHPVATGISTLTLMLLDWGMTVLQHRERARYSRNHYRSYPVDTVEGNPSLQTAVSRARLLEPRHLAVAVPVSALVGVTMWWIPAVARPLLLGFVWGQFFIVSATHLGNLIGYVGSRRGIHGRVWMHQRTGYVVQAGRQVRRGNGTARCSRPVLWIRVHRRDCSGWHSVNGEAVGVDSEVSCDSRKRRCTRA